ncbi:MAG: SPOR domain-containing protein, partial [Blastocatellia bacterium]
MAPPICATVLLLFVWLCPMGVEAGTMNYAVQVAALRSQQSATDLAKGLRAQGINAYWVGKGGSQQGVFYRVRIGKFSSIESAYRYAE